MGRINRPDTLHTELRELRRRIQLLESGLSRVVPVAARRVEASTAAAPMWAPTLVPARPRDWWPVDTEGWEQIAFGWVPPRTSDLVLVLFVAAGDGAIRTTIDGAPLPDTLEVRALDRRDTIRIPIPPAPGPTASADATEHERELSIEARGSFRMMAGLRTMSVSASHAGKPPLE